MSFADEMRRFFDPSDAEARNDLANASGAIYLNELSDYITASLYPADGSWVDAIVLPEDEADTRMALARSTHHMRNELSKSNFYGKINELIVNGLLYNKGLISVEYTEGLNFVVYDPRKVHMSKNSDEWSSRVYSSEDVSALDLMGKFKNPPQVAEDETDAGLMEKRYQLIHAIVPNTKMFVDGLDIGKEYKFAQLYLLKDYGSDSTTEFTLMEPMQGFTRCGYTMCPVLQYKTGQKQSLCKRALPDAVIVNRYEQAMLERSELANYPPMAVSANLENRGAYDLGPNGIVPVQPNEQPPTPIQTTLALNISAQEVARKEARLREIFRVDLIRQAMNMGVSQYEQHAMKYNALKSIQPLVCSLTNRTTESLLRRVHMLLEQEDKTYKGILSEIPAEAQGQFHFDNLKRSMDKSRKLQAIGQSAQAMQAYMSVNPEAAQVLDSEKAVKAVLMLNELPELIRDDAEVQAERQSFAQQAQGEQEQAMAMEEAKLQPQMQANQIKAAETAAKIEQEGGGV